MHMGRLLVVAKEGMWTCSKDMHIVSEPGEVKESSFFYMSAQDLAFVMLSTILLRNVHKRIEKDECMHHISIRY